MNDSEMYPAMDEPKAEKTPDNKPEVEGHTELVSKKLLGLKEDEEANEGDEFVLQVVKDYGDEVECKYAPKKPETKSEMSPNEELDMMDKKGSY